ncbi:Transferrin family [Melia azedarach]|uniref:Transferrin family n=1 Tax=Melia azedarach TaxID=155640 RepID=A0ACC1YCH2_MELAZ|nr:Transferrin family [Melia azedarach]
MHNLQCSLYSPHHRHRNTLRRPNSQFQIMQISTAATFLLFLLLCLLCPSAILGFAPSPEPVSDTSSLSVRHFPPSPVFSSFDSEENERSSELGFAPSPAPVLGASSAQVKQSPAPSPAVSYVSPSPSPVIEEEEREKSGDQVVPSWEVPEEAGSDGLIRWCAARDQAYEDCQHLVSILGQSAGYTWECVKRETTEECLDSVRNAEADIINLEAGLAYAAFLNYSMKAIANEVYCGRAQGYDAVAVVNRRFCQEKEDISLMDFKGHKSCHGGYFTAAGWNYPVNHIKESTLLDSEKVNDSQIASSFFSQVCAPSEFEGVGICSGCGNENGSCQSDSVYLGHSGAFRCLVEELGDIAFVRGDTVLLYSKEGPQNQSWSSKSVRDFMYLCPQGGCREINGYPGSCSFGTVPANVIMARNSIPNKKRLLILQTLTNATRTNALLSGKTGGSNIFSPSTQELMVVKKLTRSYLGKSAMISQSLQETNYPKQVTKTNLNPVPDVTSSSPCLYNSLVITLLLVLTEVLYTFVY